jgi:hypothetical protein
VKKVARKWFQWSASNDLAGKAWMEGDQYLVRCRICREEKFNGSAVWIHNEPECLKAVSILSELDGVTLSWDREAKEWYSSETAMPMDNDAAEWWHSQTDTAEPNEPGA